MIRDTLLVGHVLFQTAHDLWYDIGENVYIYHDYTCCYNPKHEDYVPNGQYDDDHYGSQILPPLPGQFLHVVVHVNPHCDAFGDAICSKIDLCSN